MQPNDRVERRGFLFRTLPATGLAAWAATLPGCGGGPPPQTLAEARTGFKTKIVKPTQTGVKAPDYAGFVKTSYKGPLGDYEVYVVPPKDESKKGPIVIWLKDADFNTIDHDVSIPGPAEKDATGSPIRKAGIGMMYPSLRGGNLNPGQKEGFFGELDDLAAAMAFAKTLPWVDPNRIYLGGHSTGGTMSLLSACYTPGWRAVFSLGPVDDVREYIGGDHVRASTDDDLEMRLRSPGYWLHSVTSPTFVFEGTVGKTNAELVRKMAYGNLNPLVHFELVDGVDHFSIGTPLAKLFAAKIQADTGEKCNIAFTPDELKAAVAAK